MSAPNPTPAPAAPKGSADDPDLGAVIGGRYRLLERIGLGGMGAVYRAEHVGMGRVVAVKLLRPELGAHADALARFEREAQAAARVAHKNVVAVSDFGVRDDGALYLVMEYLRGESLGDRLERDGRIPWAHAVAIARHVARGLAHAHERGIIHRDIKPDNIYLVTDEDDPDFAKIVDFGIARMLGGGDANVTRVGLVVGTPAYLSPEQALGGELDGRSDLYSLAIVLYEMLTGRTPFGDREPVAMLTAHAVIDPPWFGEIAPDLVVPEVLELLVRRGLAKAKEDRFADANDFAAALDEVRGRSGFWPQAADVVAFGEPSSNNGFALPGRPSGAHPRVTTPLPSPRLSTPMPVQHVSGVHAPLSYSETMAIEAGPPAGMRAWMHSTFPWTRDRARVKKIGTWLGGGLLVVGLVAAIQSAGNPSSGPGSTSAAAPAGGSTSMADAAPVAAPIAEAIELLTPGPDPAADLKLKAALHDLDKGRTCEERRAAVVRLRELGDARAVPSLKKARYRMRGGVLGVGDSNTNACLKKDLDAVIEVLSIKTN